MKKLLLIAICFSFIGCAAQRNVMPPELTAADQKLTALDHLGGTENTAPAESDITYAVDDPGGATPLSVKVTFLGVMNMLESALTDYAIHADNLPYAMDQAVNTTASPQFAGVNVGAATDTTVARVAAGVISVEGGGGLASTTPMTGDADDFDDNFTGAYLYGGTYVCNAAGTVILPAVAAGMNFSIVTLGAVEVIIDPNASDSMLTDGVQGADGENITNGSAAGDIAVVQYYSSAGWLVTTNGWTPE